VDKNRTWLALALLAVVVAWLCVMSARPSAADSTQPSIYLPLVFVPPPSSTPTATPTVTQTPTATPTDTATPTPTATPAGCQAISGVSYGTLTSATGPPSPPAASNGDINILLRWWQPTTAFLGLVSGGGVDPNAPQLDGLFTDDRVPTFSSVDQVYNWDWSTNSRGTVDTQWAVTIAGMQVQPGEVIQAPYSGYDIGRGYTALVLYATSSQILLTYTANDSIVSGYAVHIYNICTEPSLLALYNQLDASGRVQLPALSGRQPLGRANYAEIDVAIRDVGEFMDPRSQGDWWRNKSVSQLPSMGQTMNVYPKP
jgi:hypothetical protein